MTLFSINQVKAGDKTIMDLTDSCEITEHLFIASPVPPQTVIMPSDSEIEKEIWEHITILDFEITIPRGAVLSIEDPKIEPVEK